MTYIPQRKGFTSTVNTSIIPLNAGQTFTGVGELNDESDVMVSCTTDKDGKLYYDFSPDGTNWGTFPVSGFDVVAGIHEIHKAVKGNRYFRVRFTNTSGENQTYLRLYTIYGEFSQLNAPLGSTISDDSDATIVKSIITAKGPLGDYEGVKRTGHIAKTEVALLNGQSWDSGIINCEGYEFITFALFADKTFSRQISFYESDETTEVDGSTTQVALNVKNNTVARSLLSIIPRTDYLKLIVTNNSGEDMTFSNFEVTLNANPVGNSQLPLDTPLRDGTTAGLVRSVQVARQPDGDYVNSVADGSVFATTTPLGVGGIYQSDFFDTDGWKSIELVVTSDVLSANNGIQIDFTDDVGGDETVRFSKYYTFNSIDVSNGFLVIQIGTFLDGFRVKYTNGGTEQSNFYLEATLRNTTPSSDYQNLENDLISTVIAPVNRSVLVAKDDSGIYSNIGKDLDSDSLKVSISSPLTAFGELSTAKITPEIQLLFTYGVNPLLVTKLENHGTVSSSTGNVIVTTNASTNSMAAIRSRDFIHYRCGEGIVARFTGLFTDGVEGSRQLVGLGDDGEGLFFGFDDDTFGIFHLKYGTREIRVLTVTTASSTAENITVTLNSNVETTVAVTASGNITTTVNEIAAHDYSNVGYGWFAKAFGNKVYFISFTSGSKSGTYSITGSTIIGSFTQAVVGTSPTESFISTTNWNKDKADGNYALPQLDWNYGNVFQIKFQYLGYGKLSFYIENPNNGSFVNVHNIQYANANLTPSLFNPTMQLYMAAINTTNNTAISVKTASMMAGIEGEVEAVGIRRGDQVSKGSITTSEVPIVTYANGLVFNNYLNKIPVKINLCSVSNDHTKAMIIRFYSNAKLTNSSFSDIETGISPILKDTSATALSSGTFLFAIQLGANGNQIVDISNDRFNGTLTPGDSITVTAQAVSGTGATASIAMNWVTGI